MHRTVVAEGVGLRRIGHKAPGRRVEHLPEKVRGELLVREVVARLQPGVARKGPGVFHERLGVVPGVLDAVVVKGGGLRRYAEEVRVMVVLLLVVAGMLELEVQLVVLGEGVAVGARDLHVLLVFGVVPRAVVVAGRRAGAIGHQVAVGGVTVEGPPVVAGVEAELVLLVGRKFEAERAEIGGDYGLQVGCRLGHAARRPEKGENKKRAHRNDYRIPARRAAVNHPGTRDAAVESFTSG